MYTITIKTTPKTEKMLKEFPNEFKKALTEGFTKSVKFAESQIKKSFGGRGKPKVKTGMLRRSIVSDVKVAERRLTGLLSSNLIYASILETGGTIRAKSSPYLTFRIGDGWVKVKSVKIPPLPYLEPGIKDNLSEIENIITDTIATRLN